MALFCWGDNTVCGSVEDEHIEPNKIDWALQERVEFVSCGSTHSLLLTNQSKVYSCGQNDFGQLGHLQPSEGPCLVDGLENHVITRVCCGSSHSVALSKVGNVYTWGSNIFSQLGFSTDDCEPMPKLVNALDTKQIIQLSVGNHHNIALTNGGELYAWGLNHSGQCGLGDTKKILTPTKISSLNGIPIAFIACGGSHSFVISKSGAVFGFGKNHSGQLGIGDYVDRLYPTQLKTLRNISVRHISAGEDFSVFLTQEGAVLTCGAGDCGQTAHGIDENIPLPRMIFELMGVKCSQVACGSRHCLIFVPSYGRIYGFGLGSSGQLGNRSTDNTLLPKIVVGPWASSSDETPLDEFNPVDCVKASFVKRIFSGGNHSFAATSNSCHKLHDCRFYDLNTQIECMTMELIEQCAKVGANDTVSLTLMTSIQIVFGSLSCINGSFLGSENEHKFISCSKQNHGVNIENAEAALNLIQIINNETMKDIIKRSITTKLLPEMFAISSPPDMEALRVYLLLPLYHEFNNAESYSEIHTPFCRSFLGMTEVARRVVLHWWASASIGYFEKFIAHLRDVVWFILDKKLQKVTVGRSPERGIIKFNMHLKTILSLLENLFRVNQLNRKEPVPNETFYIQGLADSVHLQDDFCNYSTSQNPGDFLMNYPFIYDVPAKVSILRADQTLQMCKAVYRERTTIYDQLFAEPGERNSFVSINISRDRIVEQAFEEIAKYQKNDLKKPLKVTFVNEPAEDQGGLTKEFFMLLAQHLSSNERKMFEHFEDSRLIWFSTSSIEDGKTFELIGTLVGLALYNFQIINLPFPLALYKKLLDERLELNDFCELSPILGKSLKHLLAYEAPDMEDVFDLTFEVTRKVNDVLETFPLKVDGGNTRVNQENKEEFVNLYVDYYLTKSVEKQFKIFKESFMGVCGRSVLRMFQPHELREVIVGSENYDWNVFETVATYKTGYTSTDPTIRLFWKVFHQLSLEEKKKTLLFLTGSERIPVEGMKGIPIVIQPVTDDKYLPVAHTCFNLLDLPRYRTENELKSKLLQAIQHNDHFSLV